MSLGEYIILWASVLIGLVSCLVGLWAFSVETYHEFKRGDYGIAFCPFIFAACCLWGVIFCLIGIAYLI